MGKFLKDKGFARVLWGFFYFFIFTLLLKGSFSYLDPDLGWHLKVGEEIAKTGSVPSVNSYNYTFTGNWVDHEWLSNWAVYQIYSHWGYIVLSVLFALLVLGVLILLNIWVKRVYPQASPFFIALFQLLGVLASLPHFGVRIQEVGLLFLTLILIIIYHYNKRKNWKLLAALVPLMYLWACLHASFLIGFFIFFAWVGVKVLEKIVFRYYKKDWLDFSGLLKWREIFIFLGAALLSITSTLFTPYGLKLYSFLAGYRDNFYQEHIQEWLPQFYYPFQYRQLFYLELVVLAFIFYIYYSRGPKRFWRLDLWTLFTVSLFTFLSFQAHRHFPLLFAAAFVFLTGVFGSLFKNGAVDKINTEERIIVRPGLIKNWLALFLLACLLLVSVSQLAATSFTSDPFRSFRCDYPVEAVEFLKERPQYDPLRLFNYYGWGGYIIWTDPPRKLFIDGRLPQVEYQGHSFLEEYHSFFNKEINLAEKLNEYGIGLVLIPAKDQEIRAKRWEQIVFGLGDKNLAGHNYLRDHLSGSGGWQKIYQDETAVVYQKIR